MANKFSVAERFVSINGEGQFAGKLAYFIRFAGCDLDCAYCDTQWANEKDAPTEMLSVDELVGFAVQSGARHVTLTGGEPVLQPHLNELVSALLRARLSDGNNLVVEIETNGSADLGELARLRKENAALDASAMQRGDFATHGDCTARGVFGRLVFTMDYKLPSSGMESFMNTDNFGLLERCDVVKFVAGSVQDLDRMREVMRAFNLAGRVQVYVSCVFGKMRPADAAAYIKEHGMNDVTLQLQMHKLIWPDEDRGV